LGLIVAFVYSQAPASVQFVGGLVAATCASFWIAKERLEARERAAEKEREETYKEEIRRHNHDLEALLAAAEENRRADHAETVALIRMSHAEVPASYTATATGLNIATAHRRAISGSAAIKQVPQTVNASATASIITRSGLAAMCAATAERILRYLEQQQYVLLLASIIPGQTTSKEAMRRKTVEKENETLQVFQKEFRSEAERAVHNLAECAIDVSGVKHKLETGPKSFEDIREIAVGISEAAATLANQGPRPKIG
jgi:hypothetical protein